MNTEGHRKVPVYRDSSLNFVGKEDLKPAFLLQPLVNFQKGNSLAYCRYTEAFIH